MTGHKDAIFGSDIGMNGKVYSGGADGYVVEWDPGQDKNGNLLATLNNSVYAVRVFDQLLFAGCSNGEMIIIDLNDKKLLFNAKVNPGGIFDFYKGSDLIYIFGEKGTVTVIDSDFKIVRQKMILNDSIRQVLPYRYDLFIMACSDSSIKLVNRENLQVIETISAHESSVFSIALSEDMEKLYTGSRDATIKVWDTNSFIESMHIPAHHFHVNSLALNRMNNLLLSASLDKSIRLWDADNMQLLKVIDLPKYGMHSNSVNKVLWIEPNRFISCSDDRTLGYFQVDYNDV